MSGTVASQHKRSKVTGTVVHIACKQHLVPRPFLFIYYTHTNQREKPSILLPPPPPPPQRINLHHHQHLCCSLPLLAAASTAADFVVRKINLLYFGVPLINRDGIALATAPAREKDKTQRHNRESGRLLLAASAAAATKLTIIAKYAMPFTAKPRGVHGINRA